MAAGAFDPELLQMLDEELVGSTPQVTEAAAAANDEATRSGMILDDEVRTTAVRIETLRTGMVLWDEVRTSSGLVLLRPGERLTPDRLHRIQQFAREGTLLTTVVAVEQGTLVTDSAPPLV